jgi:hypothetical protein
LGQAAVEAAVHLPKQRTRFRPRHADLEAIRVRVYFLEKSLAKLDPIEMLEMPIRHTAVEHLQVLVLYYV